MPPAKPYHKEDLRGDLLAAGRKLVAASGHGSLSIRTLAQQVGVSPGAPYHHFADRRAFLLVLASEGFEELNARAGRVVEDGAPTIDRLTALGLSFVSFASANPRLVDLMYESELTSPAVDPALLPYQNAGHAALRRAIVSERPDLPDAEADLRVISFWSAIYGFASMQRRGVIHPFGRGGIDASAIGAAIVRRAAMAALAD